MRLLFDQNISFRIVKQLSDTFPGCVHISSLGLTNASDLDIWSYARTNNFTIVTFDLDFLNIATLKGHPPKIIHLTTGNRKTADLAELVRQNKKQIEAFLTDPNFSDIALLEISG